MTDPKLAFWTWAFANFFLVVACAGWGVRSIRRGDLRIHKRMMLAAAAFVGLFLVSYTLKVLVLGKEDLGTWPPAARNILYTHETFVAFMLLGGVFAGLRAWRFRRTVRGPRLEPASPLTRGDRTWHRRAGWVAVVSSLMSFATAALVLAGMYGRAGS